MGEIGELWRDFRASKKVQDAIRYDLAMTEIVKLLKLGYVTEGITEYQVRITRDGSPVILDIYPLSLKFHQINNNKRGKIRNPKSLISFVNSRFNN